MSRDAKEEPERSTRSVLQRYLMGAGLVAGLSLLLVFNAPVFLIIAVLAASIFVHESGHCIAAKAVGMDVSKFFLGFGPRIWSFTKSETEYGVRALPVGGYVKILGMTGDNDARPGRGYKAKSLPRKLIVVFAGSAAQIMVAFALLWGWLAVSGPEVPVEGFEVAEVVPGTPAEQAGIMAGDTVLSVDGKEVEWAGALSGLLRASSGTTAITVHRPGLENVTMGVTLKESPTLGVIGGTRYERQSMSVLAAGRDAVVIAGDAAAATVKGVAWLFNPDTISNLARDVADPKGAPTTLTPQATVEADGRTAEHRVVSIVGIVNVGSQSIKDDLSTLIPFAVSLNILVALFNLLPLPPLDGGHALIASYERIRSRTGIRHEANPRVVNFAALMVLCVLGFISLSAMFVDIANPISLGE